jgi:hypothetical protein
VGEFLGHKLAKAENRLPISIFSEVFPQTESSLREKKVRIFFFPKTWVFEAISNGLQQTQLGSAISGTEKRRVQSSL